MGAEIRFVKMRIDEDPALILERVARHLRKMGHRPYVLHLADVESPRAAVAYTEAMYELVKQAKCTEIDWLVLATAGGGTQAGLILGAKMLKEKTKIIGINVGAFRTNMITRTIEKSYQGGAELLHFSRQSLGRSDIEILDGYSGAGYGIPTKQSLDVIRFVARTESLILDPVYTSKAMAGLINLIERGRFREDDNVCFLHTGGIPALFAYGRHFSPKAKMRLGVSASMPKKKNGGPSTRR
jgi:1-aminocyclopropane-1-carboxylate deaminase/D-cysteine desulfhydrase-like pyridoxal-dependent ACC family enzyme